MWFKPRPSFRKKCRLRVYMRCWLGRHCNFIKMESNYFTIVCLSVCVCLSAVFEITFETNQTFGLTCSEIIQTKLKLARPKTYFTIALVEIKYNQTYSTNQSICLTDFQTSQTEATSDSHCPTDWPYFEHWGLSVSTCACLFLKVYFIDCMFSYVFTNNNVLVHTRQQEKYTKEDYGYQCFFNWLNMF